MTRNDSLEALQALLEFKRTPAMGSSLSTKTHGFHPEIPVPNPLDPNQPHLIEGDTPPYCATNQINTCIAKGESPCKGLLPLAVSAVPNPLAKSVTGESAISSATPTQPQQQATSLSIESHSLPAGATPSSRPRDPATRGFVTNPLSSVPPLVRTDKIQAALKSEPQRGRKRQNLNDLERLELTRTRNREHAKCTRMKKKARLQELIEVEEKYKLMKEKEDLAMRRRQNLVKFIENGGSASGDTHDLSNTGRFHSKSNRLFCHLRQLASDKILNADFSILGSGADSVATSSDNSAFVRVGVHGLPRATGDSHSRFAVVGADFTPKSADIRAISFHWSSSGESALSQSVSIFPTISVTSLETSASCNKRVLPINPEICSSKLPGKDFQASRTLLGFRGDSSDIAPSF